jgi:tripartite-type tricarboxylate transporter receptor subunit TctC
MRSLDKRFIAGLGVSIGSLIVAAAAPDLLAAEYPTKAITMLVGSTAGSPVDVMARELGRQVEKTFRKPIVVQNRSGGSQAEELSTMAAQPPDGYILGTVTTSTAGALAGHLRSQFKAEDFNFLALVQADPYAIVVKADSPFKDLKGLIEQAKSNPGKVKIGGFGTGSGHHLAFLDLADRANAQMGWVSFDGGAAATAAALGGHVDASHTNPGGVIGHVQAGKMRVLAIASEKRLDVLPDVPTYREQGFNLVLFQWRGVAMRAGGPQPVVEKLVSAIKQAAATPEFVKYMKNTNQFPTDLYGDSAQKYVAKEIKDTEERLRKLGLNK